jgi:hypothetical protein
MEKQRTRDSLIWHVTGISYFCPFSALKSISARSWRQLLPTAKTPVPEPIPPFLGTRRPYPIAFQGQNGTWNTRVRHIP